jgi:predicted MFS family arabinose efflux permease
LAIATTGVDAALLVSAGAALVGTLAFTTLIDVEGARPGERTPILHLGALESPRLRALTYASLPLGFFIGANEVALPAYGEQAGDPELGGVLLALFAAPSILAGLLYGVRSSKTSLMRTHVALSGLMPVLCVPLAFAGPPASAMALAALGGLLVSPVIASRNELVNVVAVQGRAAESFAWPLTAMIVGIAAGAAAGGALADSHGWSAAVWAAVAAGAAGAAVLLAGPRRG